MISVWAGALQNWPGDEFFKLRNSKFKSFGNISFSQSQLLSKLLTLFYLITYLFIFLDEKTTKHSLKEHRCKFEIDKLTISKT